LKAHDPGGAWDRLLALLSPEYATQVREGIMIHHWYPIGFYVELNRAIDKLLGKGDLKLVWELGRASADESLHGIYKVFFKVGSPEFVVKAAATIWKQYYDTGKLTIVDEHAPQGKRFRMIVEGLQTEDEVMWLAIGGWVERTLQLSGGKNVKVEISRSHVRPGSNCEYVCSWE